MLRSNPSAAPGVVTDGPCSSESSRGFVLPAGSTRWEVIAQATGPRGKTLAILAEHPDGTVRLRDRCAEGLTPDGTAMDETYPDRISATWDAVRLVGLWVEGPSGQPESDKPARGPHDNPEQRNHAAEAYTLTPGGTLRKVWDEDCASRAKRERGAKAEALDPEKNPDGSPQHHFPSGVRVYTWGEHEIAGLAWNSAD